MQKSSKNFSGRWFTTYGVMELDQSENKVRDEYKYDGNVCSIEGVVKRNALHFHYQEPSEQGEGRFTLQGTGRISGVFRPDGGAQQGIWTGERGFQGVWDTNYGRMRLLQDRDKISGFYSGEGGSTIQGKLDDDRVAFRYQEPQTGGEGEFVPADDMLSFHGEWKSDGDTHWKQWSGARAANSQSAVANGA